MSVRPSACPSRSAQILVSTTNLYLNLDDLLAKLFAMLFDKFEIWAVIG